MNRQTKTAQLEARQAEAIATAKEQETQARKEYANRLRPFVAFGFPFVLPLLGARKARQRYEKAQENRLCVIRQYATILQAIPTDYRETNYIKAN